MAALKGTTGALAPFSYLVSTYLKNAFYLKVNQPTIMNVALSKLSVF
jgi:hypothetical protein